MGFIEAFENLREEFEKHDVSAITDHYAYQFNITGEGAGTFYVEIKNSELLVRPYDYHDRDAEFTGDYNLFLSLAKGDTDPVGAYLCGKLKVGGSIDKALKLKEFFVAEKNAKKKKNAAKKA
jgi:putative sterol carrier protein